MEIRSAILVYGPTNCCSGGGPLVNWSTDPRPWLNIVQSKIRDGRIKLVTWDSFRLITFVF